MVRIRMSRKGTNKRPFYHIVAADKRCARDGRYIERIGFFNPIAAGAEVSLNIDLERLHYWRTQGAQLSERVAKLVEEYTGDTAKAA